MLRRLKVSDAAAKMATSLTPAAWALSRPARLGTNAVYLVPCARSMRASTSAASAICGTHFGLTKAVTSTTGRPALESRSTNATLSAVEIAALSFCSPSRGPTSTTVTRLGIMDGSWLELDELVACLNELARPALDRRDGAVAWRPDRQLHLHRFEDEEDVPLLHACAGIHDDLSHRCGHRRGK